MTAAGGPNTVKNREHGSLLAIFGIGVLLKGKSGIGKSECALDLINRGHALIADDAVDLVRCGDDVIGSSPDIIKNLLEIRGLGIVNVRDLFGAPAIRDSQKIDMIIELVEWQADMVVDRVGIDQEQRPLLGVNFPYLVIPVRMGRNLGTIVEVAVRNELLRRGGVNTALLLEKQLTEVK